MENSDGNNITVLLAEYQLMRSEIDGYYKLRNSILVIVVSSLGMILGFGDKVTPLQQIVALHLILTVGIIMTLSYTLIARRKEAYTKAFIEDKVNELNWFSVSLEYSEEYLWLKKFFTKYKIPFDVSA